MINIRKDLIEKELYETYRKDCKFVPLNPSKKFVEELFKRYYTSEFTEHFYDSCPDIPEEWEERARHEDIWENDEFNKIYDKLCDEYDEQRITFCNWIEVYGCGVWSMSQQYADKEAIDALEKVRNSEVSYKGRLFISKRERDEVIFIYYYGRDYLQVDYWWVLQKKDI